ncbi:MAG: hypothetical protein ACJAQT_000221 [Akkermansiaceae bacterium]
MSKREEKAYERITTNLLRKPKRIALRERAISTAEREAGAT